MANSIDTFLVGKRNSTDALDWLRFPMALCVVFIHSYGARVADCAHIVAEPLTWQSAYDVVRLFCSKVFPGFAVPTFFMISGYLFFLNMRQWNWLAYGEKLRRRVGSLLLPYLGWNVFHCIHLSWPTLMKIFRGEAGWPRLWALWHRFGGWGMLWDGHVNQPVYENILGVPMPFTAPVLAPLWFLRDLMVVVLLAPLIYWLLRLCGRWLLGVLGVCFLLNVWVPVHGSSSTCTFWFSVGAYHSLRGLDLVGEMRRLRGVTYPVALATMALLLCLRASHPGPDSLGLRLLNSVYVLSSSFAAVSVAGVMSGRLRWPQWLVGSTFFIYVSHIFVRKQVLRPLMPVLRTGSYTARLMVYLLVPVLTVAVCVAVYRAWKWVTGAVKLSGV